jgi:hypothetical protein
VRESESHDMEYLDSTPESVPPGKIVTQNHVVFRPGTEPGDRGFRAWTEPEGTPLHVVCDCAWAPELPEHYRVERAG